MPSAMIFDCEGERLNADEKAFFKDANPWGFIVFARHCGNADGLRAHCDELRACVGRDDAPIFIDQEGGRVARMKAPPFPEHPPAARFGELWRLNPDIAKLAARLNAYLLARMVSDCGVTANCVPMVDVPQPDADEIVLGDRALAQHPETIVALATEVINGTLEGGALPVIKHIPGHGRALCDSHHALPRVTARRADLEDIDFHPFRKLNTVAIAMTAHVVYEALDPDACATMSAIIIRDVIRDQIGFDGLLLSDDLKMKALSGDVEARVGGALEAGCDIALCCNFSLSEKVEAMKGARALDGRGQKRADEALSQLRSQERKPTPAIYDELNALLKPVTAT